MDLENLVGETLDGKYRIEKELGRGGMGAVYLSTHLGTERPVAVKVIVPQFMQRTEFVERFRREAKAAGRLRHPNVVDVTDFGFADLKDGRVAYLVMEYLDGCTLGEILDEEKKLPLAWTLDILEQVSSAISEAHGQGIIHRDLKPDNIWLEPNQRGGYTVKVLDFGIAKLETNAGNHNLPIVNPASSKAVPTQAIQQNATTAENKSQTSHDNRQLTAISENQTLSEIYNSKTLAAEAGTLIQPLAEISSEGATAILPASQNSATDHDAGTKLLIAESRTTADVAPETSSLTRVGAVLGTPLYMSPEQCRGEHLDARSDIYSLAVIAYQMLGGKTPFEGDFKTVMQSHQNIMPPPLEAKKIPGRIKAVINAALAKDPAERPQTAEGFASILRSHSEGIRSLMGSAMVIYSENFLKFITLAFIIYLPMMVLFFAQSIISILGDAGIIPQSIFVRIFMTVVFTLSGFFSGTILSGIITWLVAQKLAVPMRPLKLRPAFHAVRLRYRPLLRTAAFSSIAGFVGLAFCVVPGVVMWICWALVTPVVMMEGLRGRKAFARSYQLVRRRLQTTIAVIVVSVVLASAAGLLASFISKGIIGNSLNTDSTSAAQKSAAKKNNKKSDSDNDFDVTIGRGVTIAEKSDSDDKPESNETPEQEKERRVKGTIRESAFSMIQIPFSIFIGSYFAVVLALLYIKTRQAGGESISDLLEQFEENEQSRKKWQERVRQRLIQSGRATSKSPSSAERQS